jgi:uncharacterized protein RhaS with RHS repeats
VHKTHFLYNINRDYDPSIGRYIESDPIGLEGGSFSTYTYVEGNPVSLVDPNGLFEMYGNWGGSNWSGGKSGQRIPTNLMPPTDNYDACYAQHDYCYAARDAQSCSANGNPKTSTCDAALSSCLEAARDSGNKPSTWWGYPFIPASDAWATANGAAHRWFGD